MISLSDDNNYYGVYDSKGKVVDVIAYSSCEGTITAGLNRSISERKETESMESYMTTALECRYALIPLRACFKPDTGIRIEVIK